MLTIKQGIKLSAIIDKLNLKITNPKGTQNEVGADLMTQIVTKAHVAEQEIYALVAEIEGITPKEAETVDLIGFVKGFVADGSAVNFFRSAVKSKAQG